MPARKDLRILSGSQVSDWVIPSSPSSAIRGHEKEVLCFASLGWPLPEGVSQILSGPHPDLPLGKLSPLHEGLC